MKATGAQQRYLLDLAELDAELGRLTHRTRTLAEQARLDEVAATLRGAAETVATADLVLGDLDGEVARYEAEIDGVRRREDRDRAMLESGSVAAKAMTELQHELDTLARRQADLEDTLLGVLERREELQGEQAERLRVRDALAEEVAAAQLVRDDALVALDAASAQVVARRSALAADLAPDLVALYERLRAKGGPGAGVLQGKRCGACRIEIDRGELTQITAAPAEEVQQCPECGAILLRPESFGG